MKQILLPTDFSDYAFNAIFTAIKLQHKTPCNFILLHTYKPDVRNISSRQNGKRSGMVYSAIHQKSLDKLEETLQSIAKVSNYAQHKFSIKAEPNDLSSAISEHILKHDLDLIVMGTKGSNGAKQVFMGSNTVKVLKKIRNCPILVVPRKFNFQSLRQIVFPTEYVHFFTKAQLIPLIKLAELWRSQILIFHVAQEFKYSEKQIANREILKQRLGSINHSFYKVIINTTVANAITDFTHEQSADMICLVHYGHSFMEKLTQEPVVKSIGFHAQVPLLVLPE